MELALCVFDFQENILQFSGAFRPLYLIRNNDLIELEGNNMPIGIYDDDSPFKSTTINLKKDDVLYMFTDGYIDQKGQATGKKFKSSNLKKLLLDIHGRSMTEQKNFLDRQFEEWKGNTEQVDDVFIIGIRIN
jgi:serine phosphatase RsbU (regulator of sigma subunit)